MFQRFDIHSRIIKRSGVTFYGAKDKLLGREIWLWRLVEFGEVERPTGETLNAEKAPLRALKHPAIVKIHDIEADPDGVVALLEPATGEPLDEFTAHGPVEIDHFCQIAATCLEALAAAAAGGVPHGALEAGLIFIRKTETGAMTTSLVGFGIARLVTRLLGEEHECSEALDVWALGGILHSALTGTVAEEGQVIPAPHDVRPDVPPALSAWVMQLLSEDPQLRPQTAADALAQLRHALEPEAAVEVQPPPVAHWPAEFHPHAYPPPVWHYPPPQVWHVPPPQWTLPYDPAYTAQQPQVWQQVPWHPWQAPMPMHPDPYQQAYMQPPPVEQLHAAPELQQAATGPLPHEQKAQPASPSPNAPKPKPVTPTKSAVTSEAKSPVKTEQPKPAKSARRFIGPAISLAAAVLVIWLFRDVFAGIFRIDNLRAVLGDNVAIQWPGSKTPATAPAPAIEPTATATATAAPEPAPAQPAAKSPAKPAPPPPTGSIFIKNYSTPAKKGEPQFNTRDKKSALAPAPSSWPGKSITGKLSAGGATGLASAPLSSDPRLSLSKGTGIELQFDVLVEATSPAASEGFRFGLFDSRRSGYFVSVPAGGSGDLVIFAGKSGGKDPMSDADTVVLKSSEKTTTPGIEPGKVVHCTFAIRFGGDNKLHLEAKVGDVSAKATVTPKADPVVNRFGKGSIMLRVGGNISNAYFENVIVDVTKP